MNSLVTHATAYAAKGLRPFPILPNSKKPATGNGFHDAATDTADIERLFKNHRGNIGINPDETIFVLDVDTKHGDGYAALEQLQAQLGKLPKTLRAKTPSGGMHLYFRKPADAIVPNAANVLAPNIDFRTSKGYVVAAPSIIEGNAYEFADADAPIADAPQAWLDALANWKPAAATAATNDGGDIIAGGRNQALTRIAGAMQRHGMDSGAIIAALTEHNAAHCNPPLPPDEVLSIARSVARYSPERYRDAVKPSPPFPAPEVITADEWQAARSTPDCIVQDLFYADVAVLVAPGGMGKTTLKLFEAICITLGLPLYGLTVHKRGAVLIITAEDSREMLIARLRAICHAMQLTDADIATVMQQVRIADVSGSGFKLTEVSGDVVRPCDGIDQIIEACQTIQPVLIVIDPAVSFGVGESRVNDAEQGLIEAARKLRKALDCCIQYIHHSGKQNAREKAVDQYAGRGGSAFADGARMVHVLQSLTPDEWRNETGTELLQGESGLRLARPKMSYCAPQDDILIRRNGYHFAHVERITTSKQAKREDAANLLWGLIDFDLSQGRYHSRNTLEALDSGLKRNELRAALDLLFASLRIETRDVPNAGKGGKRQYLHPIGSPNRNGEAIENEAVF